MNEFDLDRRRLCRSLGPGKPAFIPTEQDVSHAMSYWHAYSSGCASGSCCCCELVRSLSANGPFIAALTNILEQLQGNQATETDAIISAYAFGLSTAEAMRNPQALKEENACL